MSTAIITNGAAMSGTSFTASSTPGFNGDGSGLTNLSSTSITLSNPNYAVITNGSSKLATEQFLATSRGGFGINPTTLNGAVVVSGGVIGNLPYTNANTATTLVERDASGNFSANNVTVTQLTESPNANGQFSIQSAYVSTANATATTLFSLATSSGGTHGTSYYIVAEITLGNNTNGTDTGSYQFQFKAKNLNGTVTVSSIVNQISILDASLTTTSVSVSVSTTNVLVQVTGVAATTIPWCGKFDIVQVNF